MSLVVVVSGPHAGASAGAPGLVETRRWVRESCGGDTHGTGDMPTGAAGAAGGTSEGCGEGELLCERGCVDLLSDEARCGCDDECKSDEMCVVGECRDVAVVDCASCPCADQCPVGDSDGTDSDGTDSDDGGGGDPQHRLC